MKRVYFLCALYAGASFGCRQADNASKLANVDQSETHNGGFLPKKAIVAAMLAASQSNQSGIKTLSTDSSDMQVPTLSEREPDDAGRSTPISEIMGNDIAPIVYDLDEPKGIFELTQSEQQDVDLRQWDTPVRDQGKEGLCTAFATIAAMEHLAKRKGQEFDLSERHLWSLYRFGNISMSTEAAQKTGIVSEQTWPYSSDAPASNAQGVMRISNQPMTTMSMKEVIAMVQKNKPVVWSGNTPVFDKKNGVVTGYSKDTGHAMAIVGVQFDERITGGGYFIIKNSWGPSSGDKGYIYMSFNYCSSGILCFARPIIDVEIAGDASSTNASNTSVATLP